MIPTTADRVANPDHLTPGDALAVILVTAKVFLALCDEVRGNVPALATLALMADGIFRRAAMHAGLDPLNARDAAILDVIADCRRMGDRARAALDLPLPM